MDWDDFPVILGQGSLHDLRDADQQDPRNPRLIGLRSVNAGAVGLAKRQAPKRKRRTIGFKWP